jgi:hypothetical protein
VPTVPERERVSTRSLVLALLAALLLSFAGLPALLGRAGSFVAELALVIVGALLTLRGARKWLVASGPRALVVVSALVALIAVGQILRQKRLFPWMSYTMYGRAPEGPVTFYEYQARYRSGARERFRPSTVIATLARARIVRGLAKKLDTIAELDEKQRDSRRERAELEALLSVLVAHENRTRAQDPITQVEILKVVLPSPYLPSDADRRSLMTLTMAAEAAP